MTRSLQEQEVLGEDRTGEERGGQGLPQSLGSEELPGGHNLRDEKDTPGKWAEGRPRVRKQPVQATGHAVPAGF